MSSRVEGSRISGVAAAVTNRYLRMKLSSDGTQYELAGDEAYAGTLEANVLAAGDQCTIYDKRAPGTHIYVASGAIAKGAAVSTVAGGKIQTGTGGAVTIGKALQAATADGDWIEVLPD